jgi:hypothetical protein
VKFLGVWYYLTLQGGFAQQAASLPDVGTRHRRGEVIGTPATLAGAGARAWGEGWLAAEQVPIMDAGPIIGAVVLVIAVVAVLVFGHVFTVYPSGNGR